MFFGTEGGFPTQASVTRPRPRARAQQSEAGGAQAQGGQSGAPAKRGRGSPPDLRSGRVRHRDRRTRTTSTSSTAACRRSSCSTATASSCAAERRRTRRAGRWPAAGSISGEVDWQGNVLGGGARQPAHPEIRADARQGADGARHRGVKGTDATHFDQPSGISVLRNGNLIVTDG
jgi:hypothetical protein